MVCLACHSVSGGRLCRPCADSLRPAPHKILPGGLRLIAAFEHTGAARAMVHHLKYRGVLTYAEWVADLLARETPAIPLVPIPRALTRKLKYGVDPARMIAVFLGRRLQVPVIDALARPLHAKRRAGSDHSRLVKPFRLGSSLRFEVALVDDVVTTGATIDAAVASIGREKVRTAVAANVVSTLSNLGGALTSPQPGMDRVWQPF